MVISKFHKNYKIKGNYLICYKKIIFIIKKLINVQSFSRASY